MNRGSCPEARAIFISVGKVAAPLHGLYIFMFVRGNIAVIESVAEAFITQCFRQGRCDWDKQQQQQQTSDGPGRGRRRLRRLVDDDGHH